MASGSRPDLLIAIDFGMTCTGVAYASLATGSDRAQVIQRWPGRSRNHVESKVPTTLLYPLAQPLGALPQPVAWGFQTETYQEQHQEETELKEWFKLIFDERELREQQKHDVEGTPSTIEEVERYLEDYLRSLYDHIRQELSPRLHGKSWNNARIEFVFSVPTTWTDQHTIERFRAIAGRSGYNAEPSHTVEIGLTEAEAAAVWTVKEEPQIFRVEHSRFSRLYHVSTDSKKQQGDVVLVCDAGGGTTDLTALKIKSIHHRNLLLEQIDVVQGKSVGSTNIDIEFEKLAQNRLRMASWDRPLPLNEDQISLAAYNASKSNDFLNWKCEFGSASTANFHTFVVQCNDIPPDYENSDHGIQGQKIQFQRSEFKAIFDIQIERIINLLTEQVERIEQKYPGQTIANLILAGGLGSSEYVLQQLRLLYSADFNVFPSARALQIRVAPEPQLAVSKGLIEDRLQKLTIGQSVLPWRYCRESFGVLFKEPFNPNRKDHHAQRKKETDPATGITYVTDGIDWFIQVGQPVSTDRPIGRNFFRTVVYGDPNRVFYTGIYKSSVQDPAQLAPYVTNNVSRICVVQSNFSGIPVSQFEDRKPKHCWSPGKRHYLIRYVIQAIVGPADLRFELLCKGKKVTNDQAISVEWFPAPAPPGSQISGSHRVGNFGFSPDARQVRMG